MTGHETHAVCCLLYALVDFGQILAELGDEPGHICSISIYKPMALKGKSLWGAVAERGTGMGCYFGGGKHSECVNNTMFIQHQA